MSPPKLPSLFQSIAAMMRLSALRTWRGRKLRVALTASFVVVLLPAVVALLDEDVDRVAVVTEGLSWAIFRLLVFLLPVLFTAGLIGEEVEGRTLHFLAVRPAGRVSVAIGKYLVATGAALATLCAATILMHVVGYAVDPTMLIDQIPATAQALGAACLLVIAYCGICLFWGALLPEAAGMVSVIYLGVFELTASHMPGIMRLVSLNHFARSLSGLDPVGFGIQWVPEIEMAINVAVPIGGWLLFTSLGILVVRYAELRYAKA